MLHVGISPGWLRVRNIAAKAEGSLCTTPQHSRTQGDVAGLTQRRQQFLLCREMFTTPVAAVSEHAGLAAGGGLEQAINGQLFVAHCVPPCFLVIGHPLRHCPSF